MVQGIEKEYNELDTVWFMAGSLFKNYPYDVPTEAFSLPLFTQAFAAVQASVVHLQDVTLSKRFAMVPLGPPLLSYSSTSKASPGAVTRPSAVSQCDPKLSPLINFLLVTALAARHACCKHIMHSHEEQCFHVAHASPSTISASLGNKVYQGLPADARSSHNLNLNDGQHF